MQTVSVRIPEEDIEWLMGLDIAGARTREAAHCIAKGAEKDFAKSTNGAELGKADPIS